MVASHVAVVGGTARKLFGLLLVVGLVSTGCSNGAQPSRSGSASVTPTASATASASSSPSIAVPSKSASVPSSTPSASSIDIALREMSLRQKVASLLILHSPGTNPAALRGFVARYQPGGMILMPDNIVGSVSGMKAIARAVAGPDLALPRLVAIDAEGGTVHRLPQDTNRSALTLKHLPVSATSIAFRERSQLLAERAITLNFGVIADVTSDPSSFIFPRVLGMTPAAAGARVAAAVTASSPYSLTTLKHFPGHGATPLDSHTTIPTTARSFAQWSVRDAVPFERGIAAGADVVMMGHLRYREVDSRPASLSAKWVGILRHRLGFKGVIVTDDMFMLQNSREPGLGDMVANAVAALSAGDTMLLFVLNNGGGISAVSPNTIIDGIVAAVRDGRVSSSSITADARLALALRARAGRL